MNNVDIIEDLAIGRIDWRKDSHMSQVKVSMTLLLKKSPSISVYCL